MPYNAAQINICTLHLHSILCDRSERFGSAKMKTNFAEVLLSAGLISSLLFLDSAIGPSVHPSTCFLSLALSLPLYLLGSLVCQISCGWSLRGRWRNSQRRDHNSIANIIGKQLKRTMNKTTIRILSCNFCKLILFFGNSPSCLQYIMYCAFLPVGSDYQLLPSPSFLPE